MPPPTPTTTTTTTTTAPGADVVAVACDQLVTTPWPDRRDLLRHQVAAFQAGELRSAMDTCCPGELIRLDAAIDIEARVAAAVAALRETTCSTASSARANQRRSTPTTGLPIRSA